MAWLYIYIKMLTCVNRRTLTQTQFTNAHQPVQIQESDNTLQIHFKQTAMLNLLNQYNSLQSIIFKILFYN